MLFYFRRMPQEAKNYAGQERKFASSQSLLITLSSTVMTFESVLNGRKMQRQLGNGNSTRSRIADSTARNFVRMVYGAAKDSSRTVA